MVSALFGHWEMVKSCISSRTREGRACGAGRNQQARIRAGLMMKSYSESALGSFVEWAGGSFSAILKW